jgi:hypothetical protein
LASPQIKPPRRDPLDPVGGDAAPPTGRGTVTDEDLEFERNQEGAVAGNAADFGPSRRELLGDQPGTGVKATYRGKDYDYTGAGRIGGVNTTMEPRGSSSFAEVSGNNPGAERLEVETFGRDLGRLQRERALATEQEGVRVAQLSPEQKLIEQRTAARRELETILGVDEQTYTRQAGDAATTMRTADDRFKLLRPEQQASAVFQARQQAEAQARQDYMNRVMELYLKRFNTNPFAQ